jgi:hypothetical protein
MGTANIEDFHHYKLEWWGEGGSEWGYLLERDEPVVNGELMMLDTRTVPAGRYGLRLTVVDQTGNYPGPFEIWWTVEHEPPTPTPPGWAPSPTWTPWPVWTPPPWMYPPGW